MKIITLYLLALFATAVASNAQNIDYIFYDTDTDNEFANFEESVYSTSVNVKIMRGIKKDIWNTICLPFGMTKSQLIETFGDNVELADLRNSELAKDDNGKVTSIQLKFNFINLSIVTDPEQQVLSAHFPCIIRLDHTIDASEGLTAIGVKLEKHDELWAKVTIPNDIVFKGVYNKQRIGTGDYPMVFLSNDKFYYTSDNGTDIKGFRGYFDVSSILENSDSKNINITFVVKNEDAAGIENLTDIPCGNKWVYDLQGRKVHVKENSFQSLRKGIYVIDGKKVAVQ